MKMKSKYIAAAAMLLAAVTMLCSCKSLDIMKKNHAVYKEKGNINTVEFRGKTYKLYDGKAMEGVLNTDLSLILNGGESGRLTEPDVPVLLSTERGREISFENTGDDAPLFFVQDFSEGAYNRPTKYYCEESALPEFENMIKGAKMERLYEMMCDWDEKRNDYVTRIEVASDQATNAIMKTIDRTVNGATDYTNTDSINQSSGQYLVLHFCDKNKRFTDNRAVQIVRTGDQKKRYYIAVLDNEYDGFDENGMIKDSFWKQVDPTAEAAMDALFEQFRDRVTEYSPF